MINLIKMMIVGGALTLTASAVVGKTTVDLKCNTTSCNYTEEIGPSGTKDFQGFCTGAQNMSPKNSSMICHKTNGTTCTKAEYSYTNPPQWGCICTNWNDKHEEHPSIDITCPAAN